MFASNRPLNLPAGFTTTLICALAIFSILLTPQILSSSAWMVIAEKQTHTHYIVDTVYTVTHKSAS